MQYLYNPTIFHILMRNKHCFTFVSEPAEQYRDVKQVKQKTAYRIRCGLLGRVDSSHVTVFNQEYLLASKSKFISSVYSDRK